ncbi:MAG: formate C-acetyltransferase/glycerol dehydratase family glycyl radical enzyme [Actinobacteria bacterium]|jgi:formate C-acetyltransferase|nr:MAG: formate C-acetyltransferase/glycerol dehydratase family glycyl radical enzyme [Actinomycetota bacterium]
MADTLKMKERLLSLSPQLCVERARYITRSYEASEGEPAVVRRAKAFAEILANITVNIWPDELIVGSTNGKEVGGGLYPECSPRILQELEGVASRETNPFSVQAEDLQEIGEEILPYWQGRTVEDRARSGLPEELNRRMNAIGGGMIFTEVVGMGHILLNHARVAGEGLNGVIGEIEEKLAAVPEEDGETRDFLEASALACRAAIAFAERHAREAERQAAREEDEGRKAELTEIARICRKVPARAAETLWEGLQSIYFTHTCAQIEDYDMSVSFGGIDRYLYPLYAADLEEGRLTREEACTLLECFFLKLNANASCLDIAGDMAFGGIKTSTNLIVGGTDASGEDMTNDLSLLALEARERVCMTEPNFGVRISARTSPEFLHRVSRSVVEDRGHLQFFNDDVIIPALVACGVPREEAADYSVIGCVELGIPGRSSTSANASLLDLSLCLELALNRGRKMTGGFLSQFEAGEQLGPETPEPLEMNSIEEVLDAFREQVEALAARMVVVLDSLAEAQAECRPFPFISSFTGDCVAAGKDITRGGARYNSIAVQGVGMATVGDSLAAIDQLVFQEGKVSMGELLQAMQGDFAEAEPLRQMLVNRCPKFGNDDDEVDLLCARVMDIFCDAVVRHPTRRGGHYLPGALSTNGHVAFGLGEPALPSGRRMGEPLSPGLSPCQGMNTQGPTAALKSASKVNQGRLANGISLNLEFTPAFFRGEGAADDFADLLRTYCDLGGMHWQCNIVGRETLVEAMEKPQLHQDLLVRPAGYSMRFVNLSPLVQSEMIARTAYTR